jgi:hypothetical protein
MTGVCKLNVCALPTCSDLIKNAAETDVDCGGGTCPRCGAGLTCGAATDCASGICSGGVCAVPTCTDTKTNGAETDVDCGGGTCPACANGKACLLGRDCASKVCGGGVCAVPSCSDSVQNAFETDVDCGGSVCPACADGKRCVVVTDCLNGACNTATCFTPRRFFEGFESGFGQFTKVYAALCSDPLTYDPAASAPDIQATLGVGGGAGAGRSEVFIDAGVTGNGVHFIGRKARAGAYVRFDPPFARISALSFDHQNLGGGWSESGVFVTGTDGLVYTLLHEQGPYFDQWPWTHFSFHMRDYLPLGVDVRYLVFYHADAGLDCSVTGTANVRIDNVALSEE